MYLSKFDMIIYSIENIFIMPITLNYFLGIGNNKFEIGVGINYLNISGGSIFGIETNANSYKFAGQLL